MMCCVRNPSAIDIPLFAGIAKGCMRTHELYLARVRRRVVVGGYTQRHRRRLPPTAMRVNCYKKIFNFTKYKRAGGITKIMSSLNLNIFLLFINSKSHYTSMMSSHD